MDVGNPTLPQHPSPSDVGNPPLPQHHFITTTSAVVGFMPSASLVYSLEVIPLGGWSIHSFYFFLVGTAYLSRHAPPIRSNIEE